MIVDIDTPELKETKSVEPDLSWPLTNVAHVKGNYLMGNFTAGKNVPSAPHSGYDYYIDSASAKGNITVGEGSILTIVPGNNCTHLRNPTMMFKHIVVESGGTLIVDAGVNLQFETLIAHGSLLANRATLLGKIDGTGVVSLDYCTLNAGLTVQTKWWITNCIIDRSIQKQATAEDVADLQKQLAACANDPKINYRLAWVELCHEHQKTLDKVAHLQKQIDRLAAEGIKPVSDTKDRAESVVDAAIPYIRYIRCINGNGPGIPAPAQSGWVDFYAQNHPEISTFHALLPLDAGHKTVQTKNPMWFSPIHTPMSIEEKKKRRDFYKVNNGMHIYRLNEHDY